MKSRIITLAAFFVAFGFSGVFAQETQDITASATVFDALDLTHVEDVQFGNIAIGFTPNIDVVAQEQEDVGTNWTEGELSVNGSDEQEITVIFPATVDLETQESATTETIEYSLQLADADRNLLETPTGSQINLDASGNQTLYIGGSLATIVSGMTGLYENNEVTISVEYN